MHTQATRVVEARVYTASLRIYGQLHLHPKGDVAGLLNAPRPYLAMTNCRVFRRGVAHPPSAQDLSGEPDFLVIPKDTVLWVVAKGDTPPPPTQPRRNLYVLYPEGDYVLKGDFPMPENVRIADFLVRTFSERAFHQLYKAELRLTSDAQDLVRAGASERFDLVTLNLKQVAGVFDVSEKEDKMKFMGFGS